MQLLRRVWVGSIVLYILLLPSWSFAAGPNGQNSRSALAADQQDALDALANAEQQRAASQQGGPSPKPFTLRITTPLYFNSNAQERQTGGTPTLEGDPTLELGWSRNLTDVPIKLTAKFSADTERYAHVPNADEDELSGLVRIQYYDAANDQAFTPFVSYKNTLLFKATYSPWTETKNDFSLGIAKLFNFTGDFTLLPPAARSANDAVWSVAVATLVQRRLRTPRTDSTALINTIGLTYLPLSSLSMSMNLETSERWFEPGIVGGAPFTRRDFKIIPLFTLLWDASTIQADLPQIGLQIGFERQSSNESRRSFNQWTLGPLATASWKF